MRYTLILFAALTLAAEDKPTPRPIPPERHEEVSRLVIRYQDAHLRIAEAEKEVIRLKELATGIGLEYGKLIAKLQKEYGADGCTLDPQAKTWNCPPAKGN